MTDVMWTAALILNILQLTFHQVTTNFDLFPFNNIRRYKKSERAAEAGLNALTMGFPVVAVAWQNEKLLGMACWVLGFLLLGECLTWWPCYFFGTPKWLPKWQEVYDRTHRHTIKFLPPIKDHPIPNLEHCLLQAITLSTFAATLYYRLSAPVPAAHIPAP